jgi:hypothetical protein
MASPGGYGGAYAPSASSGRWREYDDPPSGAAKCRSAAGQWFPYGSAECLSAAERSRIAEDVEAHPTQARQEADERVRQWQEQQRDRSAPRAVGPEPAGSGQRTTKSGYVACLSPDWLNDLTDFSIAKDTGSIAAYIVAGKCVLLKAGVPVTVLDHSGFLWSRVEFAYQGVKYWTSVDALQ